MKKVCTSLSFWLLYYAAEPTSVDVITIIGTGTEEQVELLSEGAVREGVDKSCSADVIKADQTLVVVDVHAHLHRLRPQGQVDCRLRGNYIPIRAQT